MCAEDKQERFITVMFFLADTKEHEVCCLYYILSVSHISLCLGSSAAVVSGSRSALTIHSVLYIFESAVKMCQ